MKGSCSDVTSDSGLNLSTNFPCLPRETGKARALEINLSALEFPVQAKNQIITVSVFLCTLQPTCSLLKCFHLRLHCYTLFFCATQRCDPSLMIFVVHTISKMPLVMNLILFQGSVFLLDVPRSFVQR